MFKKVSGQFANHIPYIICRQKASSHRIYTLSEKNALTAEIAAHDDTDEFKFGIVEEFRI